MVEDDHVLCPGAGRQLGSSHQCGVRLQKTMAELALGRTCSVLAGLGNSTAV